MDAPMLGGQQTIQLDDPWAKEALDFLRGSKGLDLAEPITASLQIVAGSMVTIHAGVTGGPDPGTGAPIAPGNYAFVFAFPLGKPFQLVSWKLEGA